MFWWLAPNINFAQPGLFTTDPHVKVSGKLASVTVAKELIMRVLDTKSTRVTLKMDVAHTEHSHVIGKGKNHVLPTNLPAYLPTCLLAGAVNTKHTSLLND